MPFSDLAASADEEEGCIDAGGSHIVALYGSDGERFGRKKKPESRWQEQPPAGVLRSARQKRRWHELNGEWNAQTFDCHVSQVRYITSCSALYGLIRAPRYSV